MYVLVNPLGPCVRCGSAEYRVVSVELELDTPLVNNEFSVEGAVVTVLTFRCANGCVHSVVVPE